MSQSCRTTSSDGDSMRPLGGFTRASVILLVIGRRSRRSIYLCDADVATNPTVRVAIVPGFLYQEYPQSGADGRILIEAARGLGMEYEVVPMASTGRLAENANRLLRYLESRRDEPLVLASISKGGSEIAAALQMDPSGQHFANVVGWADICGILRGSPVVDMVSRQRLRMLGFSVPVRFASLDVRIGSRSTPWRRRALQWIRSTCAHENRPCGWLSL